MAVKKKNGWAGAQPFLIDLADGAVSDVLQFDRFDFSDESLVVVG